MEMNKYKYVIPLEFEITYYGDDKPLSKRELRMIENSVMKKMMDVVGNFGKTPHLIFREITIGEIVSEEK